MIASEPCRAVLSRDAKSGKMQTGASRGKEPPQAGYAGGPFPSLSVPLQSGQWDAFCK